MNAVRQLRHGDIVFWVRSVGPGDTKDRVPMYYKGRCQRADEGIVGYDIRARPVTLGEGPYTATFDGGSFEWQDGTEVTS